MNMVQPIQVNDKEALEFANLYSTGRKAPVWEQALVTLWFFVTYLPLDGVTPFRYMLVLFFVGITGVNYRTIMPVILKSWPLFLLPIFGLLSFTWSGGCVDAADAADDRRDRGAAEHAPGASMPHVCGHDDVNHRHPTLEQFQHGWAVCIWSEKPFRHPDAFRHAAEPGGRPERKGVLVGPSVGVAVCANVFRVPVSGELRHLPRVCGRWHRRAGGHEVFLDQREPDPSLALVNIVGRVGRRSDWSDFRAQHA